MNDPGFSQRVIVQEDTLFREIKGEPVILSLETRARCALDPVSPRMRNALTTSTSFQQAGEQPVECDEDPRAHCTNSLAPIGKCLDQRLVWINPRKVVSRQ